MTSPTPQYQVLTPEIIQQIDDYLYQLQQNIRWGDVVIRMVKGEIEFIIPAPSIPARGKSSPARPQTTIFKP